MDGQSERFHHGMIALADVIDSERTSDHLTNSEF